jgi:hypothetical protein
MPPKHQASRTHATAIAAVRRRGGHPSREISRTRCGISRDPVVLVVERDNLLRWALFETLTSAGFRVLAAQSSVCAGMWLRKSRARSP